MMTTADSPVFVDTNVLVYANTEGSPWRDVALDALTADIRKFQETFDVADDSRGTVFDCLLLLLETVVVGGKQIHDANIVATMLSYGVPRLLTHNVSDFTRYSGLIEVLPLEE